VDARSSAADVEETGMAYVDGFLLALPKNRIAAYQKISRRAGRIWREHGALEYRECVGEDLDVKFGVPFPRGIGAKRGETVLFSWIVYKSRAHRDRVNKKVMSDPRLNMEDTPMPFDVNRMWYGGFDMLVDV
jgi:uncharacterized protein YbaA (DUF1428 family)